MRSHEERRCLFWYRPKVYFSIRRLGLKVWNSCFVFFPQVMVYRNGVWGAGFGVSGAGFGVSGQAFKGHGSWFMVHDFGCRVQRRRVKFGGVGCMV